MTICLNMIVKNESEVIQRCLESVKKIIDYWVIVDTGSNDGTQSKIVETMRGIPGKLVERPWVNFCHNRNEALQLAKGLADYILFIDADETLSISPEFDKKNLEKDFYLFRLKERSSTDLFRLSLIRNDPAWVWEGVLHEYLNCSTSMTGETLAWIVKDGSLKDGNRSKNPRKQLEDALILTEALKTEPNNSRYVFYLAQSYGNAGEFSLAIQYYQQRTTMEGNPDEVFWSYYCIGLLQQHIHADPALIIESYSRAYQYNPARAEPLYQLANYFYQTNHPLIGYFLAQTALELSSPTFGSYFHAWVYEYATAVVFASCAHAIGFKEKAIETYRNLLTKNLPDDVRASVTLALS